MMENIKELKALLGYPKDIVITTHRNPDGDAIGSSLGVYHFLNKLGTLSESCRLRISGRVWLDERY